MKKNSLLALTLLALSCNSFAGKSTPSYVDVTESSMEGTFHTNASGLPASARYLDTSQYSSVRVSQTIGVPSSKISFSGYDHKNKKSFSCYVDEYDSLYEHAIEIAYSFSNGSLLFAAGAAAGDPQAQFSNGQCTSLIHTKSSEFLN